jgi:hypothetical protein
MQGRCTRQALALPWPTAGKANSIAAEAKLKFAVIVIVIDAAGAILGPIAHFASRRAIIAQSLGSNSIGSARANRLAYSFVEKGSTRTLDAVGLVKANLTAFRA